MPQITSQIIGETGTFIQTGFPVRWKKGAVGRICRINIWAFVSYEDNDAADGFFHLFRDRNLQPACRDWPNHSPVPLDGLIESLTMTSGFGERKIPLSETFAGPYRQILDQVLQSSDLYLKENLQIEALTSISSILHRLVHWAGFCCMRKGEEPRREEEF
jgi:hypothetical protein